MWPGNQLRAVKAQCR